MANVKITDLAALTNPASTDVLPIVDVGADVTKKISIADLLENAGSGTASAPGIAFDGDSNTGIYRPGPDQLAISTNGAQALYINADGDILVADGNRMEIDEIRARDGAGLKLFDDSGAGIFIEDGGNVGINTTSGTQLTLERTGSASDYSLKFTRGNKTDQGIYTDGAGIALRGVDASNGYTQVRIAGQNIDANDFDRIEFYVENTEQLRITSDRYVRLASGTGGIQFGGDTAAANALDDYEEGTHTTTATCTSGTVTLSSTVNELAYTKIGKLVSVHGRINVDTISNPTGNLTLSLPFVSADLTDSAGRCAGSIRLRIVDTGYDVGLFSCSVDENSSDFRITYGGSTDTVDAAPAMKTGTQIYISITYRTT